MYGRRDNLRQKLHWRAFYQILRRGRLRVRDFLSTKYRENVVAVLILGRVLANREQREQVFKCQKFYHFSLGRGHNPFFNITIAVLTFVVNQQQNEAFPGFYFLRIIREKSFKSNLVSSSNLKFSIFLYFKKRSKLRQLNDRILYLLRLENDNTSYIIAKYN